MGYKYFNETKIRIKVTKGIVLELRIITKILNLRVPQKSRETLLCFNVDHRCISMTLLRNTQ